MGSQTSALLKGFDYQFLFTWYQIAAMLQGRSHILKIEIESKDCKSVDDVVIYYDDEGIEDKGKSVYRDFYQVKYHVDKSNSYCCEYLIQKKTSQKSLLEKFFDAFEKIEKDGVSGYRLILVSNWEWDSNDILYKKLREDKEGALPEEFFTSSDKTKIGKIIEKWQSHLNTDREGIIRFAKSLRLDLNHFGRKHFEELVYNRIENAGLIVPDDCNKISNYTQIISNLIQTGLCTITPESIKSICETHGLISKQTVTNIPTPIIGIRSYMRFAERIEDDCTTHKCVARFFNGRHILDNVFWNREIVGEISDYFDQLRKKIDLRNVTHNILLECNGSIAFLCGYLLPKVSSTLVNPVQKGYKSVCWEPTSLRDDEWGWVVNKNDNDNNSNNVVIAISITHDIHNAVTDYIRKKMSHYKTYLHLINKSGTNPSCIENGDHATVLADQLISIISSLRSDTSDLVSHVFFAAPNGFMFYLGRNGIALGKMQLYEYDFGGDSDSSYSPSIHVPIII